MRAGRSHRCSLIYFTGALLTVASDLCDYPWRVQTVPVLRRCTGFMTSASGSMAPQTCGGTAQTSLTTSGACPPFHLPGLIYPAAPTPGFA